MKKLLSILIAAFAISYMPLAICQSWWIDSYDTTIDIQEDGTILITEEIDANFSTDPHHGIYRNIPRKIAKEDGHIEKLRLNLISVTDDKGNPLDYTKTPYATTTQIKIGDADILIQASKTYIITYEVLNGLSYFEDHDEIYWNTVGTEWEAEIRTASATVTLPSGEILDTICYTGPQDSTDQNCTASTPTPQTAEFQTTKLLNWYEGFTIAVSFPKGLVTEPVRYLWLLQDYWPIILIPIAFGLLFRRWKKYGKDKKIHTIVPEYEPPKEISPIEASILIDEKADMRDISAILIDLAIRGFVKIEEVEEKTMGIFKKKDYHLHRLKFDQEKDLQLFEQELLNKIFTNETVIKISELQNKFYKHIPVLKKQMFEAVLAKKLFVKNPQTAKTPYIIIGVAIVMAGFTLVGALAYYASGTIFGLSLVVCGILTVVFGFYMPQKTDQGHELFKKILGLKMYIETAEKDRIKFHEKQKHFEQLLPYAMIFNQSKHWSKQFEDIYLEPPDWYTAQSWGAASVFSLSDFTHNLENCTSAISTSLASSPGGSGSGFSGGGSSGGGGGGGGGAW